MTFESTPPDRALLRALVHTFPPGQWFTPGEAKQVLTPALLISRKDKPLAKSTLLHTWRNIHEWAIAHGMLTRAANGRLYHWGKPPTGPTPDIRVMLTTTAPNPKVYTKFRLAMPLDLEFTSTQAINTIESQHPLSRMQATNHWRRIRKYCEASGELQYLTSWRRGGTYKWTSSPQQRGDK